MYTGLCPGFIVKSLWLILPVARHVLLIWWLLEPTFCLPLQGLTGRDGPAGPKGAPGERVSVSVPVAVVQRLGSQVAHKAIRVEVLWMVSMTVLAGPCPIAPLPGVGDGMDGECTAPGTSSPKTPQLRLVRVILAFRAGGAVWWWQVSLFSEQEELLHIPESHHLHGIPHFLPNWLSLPTVPEGRAVSTILLHLRRGGLAHKTPQRARSMGRARGQSWQEDQMCGTPE